MTSSAPLLEELMLVSVESVLVVSVSFRAFFLVLPAFPPIDFLPLYLGFAGLDFR
jgi:hypothetical protein